MTIGFYNAVRNEGSRGDERWVYIIFRWLFPTVLLKQTCIGALVVFDHDGEEAVYRFSDVHRVFGRK
jgi:hypothetical protein